MAPTNMIRRLLTARALAERHLSSPMAFTGSPYTGPRVPRAQGQGSRE